MNPAPRQAAGPRADVVRALTHFAVLLAIAVPLVVQSGRSYQDIERMRAGLASESASLRYLAAFAPLLFDLEYLRASANRPQASGIALARISGRVDADLATLERGGFSRDVPAQTCEVTWQAWRRGYDAWLRARSGPPLVESISRATCFVNAKLNESQLGNDPDPSVGLLTSVFGLNVPGLLRRIGATASLVDENERGNYSRSAIVAISRSNGYVVRLQNNIDAYVQEDETRNDARLAAQLTALEKPESLAENRFVARVDAIITSSAVRPGVAAEAERLALATVAANRPLWRRALREMETRLASEQGALRLRIAATFVFVAAGLALALAALLVSSWLIDRRYRRQLARLGLERDSLAAELGRAAAERSLSLTEGQLRAVFESAFAGIAIFDPERRIVQKNRTFADLAERHPQLEYVARERADATFTAIATPARFEVALEAERDAPAWINLSLAGVFEGDACRYVIVTVTDISDRKEREQRLLDDSLLDPLTGLANRKALVQNLSAASSESGPAIALAFIDLDGFKPINDRFGHAAGDAVLVAIAGRLRAAVGPGDVVARLGGDEFAILMRGVGDAALVASISGRIARAIRLPIALPEGTVNVSASVGYAIDLPAAARASAEDLLARADAAMYREKVLANVR